MKTIGFPRIVLVTIGRHVEVDEGVAWVRSDDVGEVASEETWVALLPSLDPTTMGWKERFWYLGDTAPQLFDRNGNAGPTIWANGKVVGGWLQRSDGAIALEFLHDVGRETREAVEEKANTLHEWMGAIRVTPRFRTPLEKRLSA